MLLPPKPSRSIRRSRSCPLLPTGKFHTAPEGHATSCRRTSSALPPWGTGTSSTPRVPNVDQSSTPCEKSVDCRVSSSHRGSSRNRYLGIPVCTHVENIRSPRAVTTGHAYAVPQSPFGGGGSLRMGSRRLSRCPPHVP